MKTFLINKHLIITVIIGIMMSFNLGQAVAKDVTGMTASERIGLFAAYARGVTTFASHATDNADVKCANDVVRITESCLALYKKSPDLDAFTFYRAIDVLISSLSIYNYIKKDDLKKQPERPKSFGLTSVTMGLVLGLLEGLQAVRLAKNDFGVEGLSASDRDTVESYETSKLLFLRMLEKMIIHSPLYEKITEESKGKMLLWGAPLAVSFDFMLNEGASVKHIKKPVQH